MLCYLGAVQPRSGPASPGPAPRGRAIPRVRRSLGLAGPAESAATSNSGLLLTHNHRYK